MVALFVRWKRIAMCSPTNVLSDQLTETNYHLLDLCSRVKNGLTRVTLDQHNKHQ